MFSFDWLGVRQQNRQLQREVIRLHAVVSQLRLEKLSAEALLVDIVRQIHEHQTKDSQ